MELKRAVNLPLLVLYGLGITIGAGIYVLIGSAIDRAGYSAPLAFLIAAIVMSFSALTFAEFSVRIPKSAGEALYVGAGFSAPILVTLTGLLIIIAAIVAGAAISVGSAGYIGQIVPMPEKRIIAIVVVAMVVIATRGVRESLIFTGVLTIVETLGLVAIVGAGIGQEPQMLANLPQVLPQWTDVAQMTGLLGAVLVAFFAFIGFDDIVNMVEETQNPSHTLPRAIFWCLGIVTVLYFAVVFVATQAIDHQEIVGSEAPVGLLFERLTGMPPLGIILVAIFATLNGVVIEIIMASRVIYGLARDGKLPSFLGQVSGAQRIPLFATLVAGAIMLACALLLELDALVDLTSQMVLGVFALVNMSLVLVKLRGEAAPGGAMVVPMIVPVLGAGFCLFLLLAPLVFAV